MKKFVLFVLTAMLACMSFGQMQEDSLVLKNTRLDFQYKMLYVPVGLMVSGIIADGQGKESLKNEEEDALLNDELMSTYAKQSEETELQKQIAIQQLKLDFAKQNLKLLLDSGAGENDIEDLKAKSDLTEDMKNTDMLYWVGTMNAIKQQAEEIILKELIYV